MKKENKILENILNIAEEERCNLKHPYVGSEHLFLAILKSKNIISNYLKNYNLTYSLFKKELVDVVGRATIASSTNLYTPLLRKIIKRSETTNQSVEDIYERLFISMLDEGEGIAIRIMLRMDIDLDEIYLDLKEKEKLNSMEESNKVGILLNNNVDLNESVLCREKEIEKLILTLSRKKKCNPLLIGPAGVGKTAIVEELVRRIEKSKVPEYLKNTKVYTIEMGSLISGTKYRGDFEERLNKIIKEVVNYKKAIIFIDEIHTMVEAGGAEGAVNASNILKPYLARGDIKCIGATTNLEYNNSILKDKALARRFDIINVLEPSNDEMILLLNSVKKEYEKYHQIKIPKGIIKKLIDLSDQYIKNISNPDKSIDLLDSSCAYAKLKNKTSLSEEDIINTIYNKTSNVLVKNKEFIYNLSRNLKNYFSKETLYKITSVFNKACNLPISIIINSDDIKNIITKELGNINIIDVDLKDYPSSLFINKNINETILSSLIERPYSLINIRNIDKGGKVVIDEIIKINKEGFINLNHNEKIYFNNAIIMLNLNQNDVYQTGFNKTIKNKFISDELIKSFRLDLRNITLKESISS